jgi:hypothetical protein
VLYRLSYISPAHLKLRRTTAPVARAPTARTGQFHRTANGACPEARATQNLRAPPALQFAWAPPPWSSTPSPPEVQITPSQLPTCCLRPQKPAPFPLQLKSHYPTELTGAQGRIRTSVARKERQIYSLLPLTARPPVHILREHPLDTSFSQQTHATQIKVTGDRGLRSLQHA